MTTLRAEWRLTTSDADGIALAGESLREKLVAAHVFGEDNPWRVVSIPVPNYVPSGVASPTYARFADGGFTLSFVGVLSDVQRKAALAVAMAQARQRAAELAEIAGGRIDELSFAENDTNHSISVGSPYTPTTDMVSFPRSNRSEMVSPSPDLPECTVRITLSYRLLAKTLTNP